MDVEITKLNGDSVRLSELGVIVQDVNVSSIPIEGIYGHIEGRAGNVDYGAELGSRIITVPFILKAVDMADYPLLRDEVFSVVISGEPFYIRELRRPKEITFCDEINDDLFVGGKRYLVRVTDSFEFDQQFRYGFGEMVLETTDLPFAESIGTTKDIDKNGINSEAELWGYGMGLIADDDSLIYTHTKNNFMIYNAGNVPVHPFEQQLKITIDDVRGSSKEFQLRNKTNGTTFKVNEGVKSNQEIVLDGANITSNSLAYLRKTNKQYIVLEKGWNEFEVNGATSARISFDFKFYYL